MGMEDSSIKTFCSNYNLTTTINKPICYKNPDKPTCIDLVLNCPWPFQNSYVIETGFPDFHKMVIATIKTSYKFINL